MEKNFKDYISVIFVICLVFFLLIRETEGLQKKTDKKELENIDYSKYERIYLDCVFDLEIKKPSNFQKKNDSDDILKKEVKYINENESFCLNRELKYFNIQHCLFDQKVGIENFLEQTSLEFKNENITQTMETNNSTSKTIVNLIDYSIIEETEYFDDKKSSLVQTLKYGNCERRVKTRKF